MRRIVFILILSIMSLVFVSCGKKIVEKSLYDYKTDYVGDNTKVVHIIEKLPYKDGVTVTSTQLLTDNEPYGIRIFIENSQLLDMEELFKNTVVSFALIGNLDTIEYVDDISKEILHSFDRADIDEQLEKLGIGSTDTIGSSKENIEKFLN